MISFCNYFFCCCRPEVSEPIFEVHLAISPQNSKIGSIVHPIINSTSIRSPFSTSNDDSSETPPLKLILGSPQMTPVKHPSPFPIELHPSPPYSPYPNTPYSPLSLPSSALANTGSQADIGIKQEERYLSAVPTNSSDASTSPTILNYLKG